MMTAMSRCLLQCYNAHILSFETIRKCWANQLIISNSKKALITNSLVDPINLIVSQTFNISSCDDCRPSKINRFNHFFRHNHRKWFSFCIFVEQHSPHTCFWAEWKWFELKLQTKSTRFNATHNCSKQNCIFRQTLHIWVDHFQFDRSNYRSNINSGKIVVVYASIWKSKPIHHHHHHHRSFSAIENCIFKLKIFHGCYYSPTARNWKSKINHQ